jgi:UDP:flavonoid glycosyltransferase YjiC (YdhE family)
VRILITFATGTGHFHPLVPLARAAAQAGHDIAFAGAPAMVPTVAAAGFPAFAAGLDVGGSPEALAVRERYRALPTVAAREALLLREGFAGFRARHKAADLLRVCAHWPPDLLVREEVDFGSAVAAERLALPHAAVLIIAAGSLVRHALVAEPLNRLRAAHGLAPDPDLAMLSRYLVLSPFPPRYRDPAFPLPPTGHALRPLLHDRSGAEGLPPWVARLPAKPTVYFSLGTAFNTARRDLFAPVIAGLCDLPVNLIVTVGRTLDPAEFGTPPPNVRIERYIPQSLLLPRCDLAVTHGGSGSVMGALAHGVPLVLLPQGADQPLNAGRCAALGVARVIEGAEVTPEAVRQAAGTVLGDPAFRRNARQLQAEIAALPGPEFARSLLERLAATRAPQMASG